MQEILKVNENLDQYWQNCNIFCAEYNEVSKCPFVFETTWWLPVFIEAFDNRRRRRCFGVVTVAVAA